MTFRLGLTGSIGMGKSTTAAMFARRGHPVWDADAAVHRLYAAGGAATGPVAAAFPGALTADGIDRAALKQALAREPGGLSRLESIVHPLVAADRVDFVRRAEAAGVRIVVLDIPLLFETGAEAAMDGVAVVSTSEDRQAQRVMARPGMTRENFDLILSRQMPDAEKRARADWVIPTDNIEQAEAAVAAICSEIGSRDNA
ncbi:dephospho-CoA kinase [Paracoccus isoporae]|uniref:Dephospho-CoA kinase n=1 Tax=Paracoccus isoporae TaxID=591205 RepID=A0A1G6UY24_9RHOB|nr:dephospho-CoA kinase [Paracoccus isoporae]SDD46270.1 dephospho-CoA kinase [Paracoccus isoporae]